VASEERSKPVIVFTDGACSGNPGPGGWAATLQYGSHERVITGAEVHTTNNRMELTAAVRGLASLKESCEVEITTDSEYVKNGITRWKKNWKRNGWINAQKQPVANRDLWEQLDEQVSRHQTRWLWTKGHADHAGNNRCDELANRAAREQIPSV